MLHTSLRFTLHLFSPNPTIGPEVNVPLAPKANNVSNVTVRGLNVYGAWAPLSVAYAGVVWGVHTPIDENNIFLCQ
jgi:hypothetical protein